MKKQIISLLSAILFLVPYTSFGANNIYKLDWDNASEYVEYHSCGCGDSCWVAEVRDKKSKTQKLKLRCDCEKLYV